MRISVPIEVDTRTDEVAHVAARASTPCRCRCATATWCSPNWSPSSKVPTDDEGLEDAMPVAMAITTEDP